MKSYCSNCHHLLPDSGKFCPHCGQKTGPVKLSFWDMLRKLWSNTFHLESKFLRSVWELFIPARLSLNYFGGKQNRYPPPLRIFAIVAFFFLLLLNYLFDEQAQKASTQKQGSVNIQVAENGDTVSNRNIRLQGAGEDLFIYGDYIAQKRVLQQRVAQHPEWQKDSSARQVADSLLQWMEPLVDSSIILLLGVPDPKTKAPVFADTVPLNMGFHSVRVRAEDIFLYPADTLIRRYGFTDWKDKLVVRQALKTMRNPNAMGHTYIGSLTWTLLSVVAIMALLLKLLYRRQQRFYMEHFIVLLHFHASAMLIFGIGLLLDSQLGSSAFALLTLLGLAVFWLLAIRRFYQEAWGKTLLKYFIYSPLYLITSLLMFFLGLLFVLILF